MRCVSLAFTVLAIAALTGCPGGTARPFISVVGPDVTPSSLSFNAVGKTQTVTVSESGYGGAFSAVASNAAVAAVSPSSGDTGFTVTAVGGGTATITFTDSHGGATTVSVGVTTSGIIVNAKPR